MGSWPMEVVIEAAEALWLTITTMATEVASRTIIATTSKEVVAEVMVEETTAVEAEEMDFLEEERTIIMFKIHQVEVDL